jgi:hypothetical protein
MTSGFIDLATFDEIEKYLYGGSGSVSYFVRKVVKSSWFTIVPVTLQKNSGMANFGQQWSASVSRAGDYMVAAFLRVTIPAVQLNVTGNRFGSSGSLRWTRNLMHSLIREVSITFNDLCAMRLDNYYLDYMSQFQIPAGKKNGYANMIGNVDSLYNPVGAGATSPVTSLTQATLNLPLPLAFFKDSGVALPTAALPYNQILLNFNMRDWSELLILDNVTTQVSTAAQITDLIGTAPTLLSCDVWAEYALVSNVERTRMGQAPRDILIEQVQTAPPQSYNASSTNVSFDIRLSHAIKTLMFAIRNTTNLAEWANYTSASPVVSPTGIIFSPDLADDPIQSISLLYESTNRLTNMGSDYFSLVQPYYRAVSIPTETGYHIYSYTLDIMSMNPMGSTNYGKLTNVSIQVTPSNSLQVSGASTGTLTNPSTANGLTAMGAGLAQTFQWILVATNWNLVRVSGGALGLSMGIVWLMAVLMTTVSYTTIPAGRSKQVAAC